MTQLEKGRTFDSYADFIKEVESYEEKTCTKFVKRGAKTVAAKNKEIGQICIFKYPIELQARRSPK